MKFPRTPPSHTRIVTTASKLVPKHLLLLTTLDDDRYLHWDDLRRRNPPAELSTEQWWALLKLRRMGNLRPLPLTDVADQQFSWNPTDKVMELVHFVDLWAGGLIGLTQPDTGDVGSAASVIANRETQGQYLMSSLINEATTSSQLEGASTTREVAQDMLVSKRKPRDQSERMILNNFLTMQRVGELRDEPLTPALVFELHRLVTCDTLADADAAGRFRRDDEAIVISNNDDQILHRPPPAATLAKRLALLCDFANGKSPTGFMHPAVRAITLHFWLAYDHPFVDGNGRTARALFYWSMLRAGYWLFEYISISEVILRAPAKYGRAFLLTESDNNDLTYFVLHQLDVIREALETLKRFITRKADDVRVLDTTLRGAVDRFNHRQRELLGHALRHPTQVYTIAGHQARQAVVYQTARTDLLSLADAGLFTKGESGNKLVFRPAPDLARRLKALGDTG